MCHYDNSSIPIVVPHQTYGTTKTTKSLVGSFVTEYQLIRLIEKLANIRRKCFLRKKSCIGALMFVQIISYLHLKLHAVRDNFCSLNGFGLTARNDNVWLIMAQLVRQNSSTPFPFLRKNPFPCRKLIHNFGQGMFHQ